MKRYPQIIHRDLQHPRRAEPCDCQRSRLRWLLLCAVLVGMWPVVWYAAIRAERAKADERAMLDIVERSVR